MRGKEQLIYMGQPFIFEKLIHDKNGQLKKIWRCNQWWNEKCRARVYTIDKFITPLNKFHTHTEVIKRKQRIGKKEKLAKRVKNELGSLVNADFDNEEEDANKGDLKMVEFIITDL